MINVLDKTKLRAIEKKTESFQSYLTPHNVDILTLKLSLVILR